MYAEGHLPSYGWLQMILWLHLRSQTCKGKPRNLAIHNPQLPKGQHRLKHPGGSTKMGSASAGCLQMTSLSVFKQAAQDQHC